MADNFKLMALSAPNDCKIAMRFSFSCDLPIIDFLHRIDIPKLFRLCCGWHGSRFMFRMCGVTNYNTFVTEDIYLYQSLLHCAVNDIEGLILKEINNGAYGKFFGWLNEPYVKEMQISYNI